MLLLNLEKRQYARWSLFPIFCAVIAIIIEYLFCKMSQLMERSVWGYTVGINIIKLLKDTMIMLIVLSLFGCWLTQLIANDLTNQKLVGKITEAGGMNIQVRIGLEIKQYIFAGEFILLMIWYSIRRITKVIKLHENIENE